MSEAESKKGKRLEELASRYSKAKEDLVRAQKEYELVDAELEKEGVMPARLKAEDEEIKTFEDLMKADPDLYELGREYAIFAKNKSFVGMKMLTALQVFKTQDNVHEVYYEFGHIRSDNKKFDKLYNAFCSNEAEWLQEKLELVRRYEILKKK